MNVRGTRPSGGGRLPRRGSRRVVADVVGSVAGTGAERGVVDGCEESVCVGMGPGLMVAEGVVVAVVATVAP